MTGNAYTPNGVSIVAVLWRDSVADGMYKDSILVERRMEDIK